MALAESGTIGASAGSPVPGRIRLKEYAGIVLATLLAYSPTFWARFVWDDEGHVTKPELRSLHGLWRIWFELGATQQYYPVLHSAFWIEHRFFGDTPAPYHVLNILLHATVACLLVAVLRTLRIPGAGFAGLLFALHPVCVESVAWISEEKNTLSATFYLLSALTYFRWRERGGGGRYAGALALFLFAVLSKSVAATLPAALLVVLWWRGGRLSRKDILPLLPWFVVGIGAGLTTAWVERTLIGANGPAFALNFPQRCILAGKAICFYLEKLLWPFHLSFMYPRWLPSSSNLSVYRYPAAAVVLAALLWCLRNRTRAPLASYLFFVGTLFPALGFFNVFPFLYSFVADHFQYLACMGVFTLVGAGWALWLKASPRGPIVAGTCLLGLLGILTWRQTRIYSDHETLYRSILVYDPDSWMAHTNLGGLLSNTGHYAEAVGEYQQALRIRPNSPAGENDLGIAMYHLGWKEEAIAHYQAAIRLNGNYSSAYFNLGQALADLGRPQEAIQPLKEAIRTRAHFDEAARLLAKCEASDKALPPAADSR